MNMLKYLNSLNKSLDETRAIMYSHHIKWCDDRTVNDVENRSLDTKQRVIFYSDKFKSDFKNPIVKECNGVVFTYNPANRMKWSILSAPPECFNMNPLSVQKMNKHFLNGSYKIYEAIDGTTLTLYYYDSTWRMSSYKGYDISHLHFCNGKTYGQVFEEIVNQKYPKFSFNNLNKNKSYTVCLRYKDYHIFDESTVFNTYNGNSYIIFIQSVDLSNEKQTTFDIKPNYYDDIGLPIQKPIDCNEKSINSLFNYAKQSYSKYEADVKTNNILTCKPLYGYILRSRNIEHEYRNIYIESSLMKYIRLALYNFKKQKRSELTMPDHIILSTILNRSDFQKYYNVFRQFRDKYDKLFFLIKYVIPDVISSNMVNISKDEEVIVDVKYASDISNLESFKILIRHIISDMKKDKIIINNETINTVNVVYDYIHSVRFLSLYELYLSDNW